ncbi:MAG: ABC transporter ATP-binding protein [Bacteroidota bacterium]
MGNVAIEVKGLGKRFFLNQGKSTSLRESMGQLVRGREVSKTDNEFWALQDVNFTVAEGEAIGIIGRNGAGKSTLLKVLSKITPPTRGKIEINGRMASLLEVGTGFHPELTGRENIFLNGTILGMSRAEVREKFDEIVDFSGVEKFLDTPVKRYSSGMYVRLAFSVAAHLEPEILVIDEVLAVGDAEFQQKCLGKMSSVASEGRTVLFVSHNMTAVQTLCQRGVLLQQGSVMHIGSVSEAVEQYLGKGGEQNNVSEQNPLQLPEYGLSITEVACFAKGQSSDTPITTLDPVQFQIKYALQDVKSRIDFTLRFYNKRGEIVFVTGSSLDKNLPQFAGKNVSVMEVPAHFFNSGVLDVELLILKDRRTMIRQEPSVLQLTLVDGKKEGEIWLGRPPGDVFPKFDWHTYSE